jgi:exopolysaccharide biosynthesis protein
VTPVPALLEATRAILALSVAWRAVCPGVSLAELPMAARGALSPVQAVAVRIDPARVTITLDRRSRDYGLSADWSVERMPPAGVVAFNAGQFTGGYPWGWLVRDGVEAQPPGSGALGMSLIVDAAGRVSLVMPAELSAARAGAMQAFQSYPALLVDGRLPWELQAPGRGVDLAHRDSRLAVGLLPDSTMVVVLTRFTGLGSPAETFPWGPTVPEMAAFMKGLGCVRAMLLDGGISAQLALRLGNGIVRQWSNWRAVPLGLIVTPRAVERPDGALSGGR